MYLYNFPVFGKPLTYEKSLEKLFFIKLISVICIVGNNMIGLPISTK